VPNATPSSVFTSDSRTKKLRAQPGPPRSDSHPFAAAVGPCRSLHVIKAVVPGVTLVTRKSYGGAYIAINSRALGATAVFAWPIAEVAAMGAKAALGIVHRKKLASAPTTSARPCTPAWSPSKNASPPA
jgi:hypothetical protein